MNRPTDDNSSTTTLSDAAEASPPRKAAESGAEPLSAVVDSPSPYSFQLIWLVPLLALLIGGWLAYKTQAEKGPDIVIQFKTAEGLVAGKTRVKYKAVEVGEVEAIHLNEDLSGVKVHVRMQRASEPFLRENSKFWVVRPRLSLRGVSGLDTLVSGAHIEIEPGAGESQRLFLGLENPPVVKMSAPGGKYILQTESLGSLDTGSLLYYRDIPAGEVLGYNLAPNKQSVYLHLFVRAPYHTLVQENTRFWRMSGVDLSLSAEGVKVKTESLQSLLMGGIAFDTPPTLKESGMVQSGHTFWLYDDKRMIAEQAYTRRIVFALYFNESVRGLSVGAPVEFRGIKVGKVTEINMEYDAQNTTFRIPVLIQIEPERMDALRMEQAGQEADAAAYDLMEALIQRGLRAQLQTGSYLTGQRFVELDIHPKAPPWRSGLPGKFPEMPTMPGNIGEITESITMLLKTLQSMPLAGMAEELHGALKGANQTINAPELLETIRATRGAAVELNRLLAQMNKQPVPLGERIAGIGEAAHKTLLQTEKTLADIEAMFNPNAPLHYQMMEVTQELSATARVMRSFIEQLQTKPESLLFGKDK
ncbi:MAG: MCE family protein [Magnetococcales bacterium]|nr:MCE family protein [Magnetococcales bacterium]